MLKKLSEKKWYSGAVIACIAVAFFVLLSNFSTVLSAIGSFLRNFRAVFLAFIFAYILNPFAEFFYYKLFSKMKLGKARWAFSVAFAVVIALLALVLMLGMLIPQLMQSVLLFAANYEKYAASLTQMIQGSPLELFIDPGQLQLLTENALNSVSDVVQKNASGILSFVTNSGKSILVTVIAMILAVYVLLDKKKVMGGFWRLMRLVLRQEANENFMDFTLRCDTILRSYLGQTILDCMIIGSINAVFMAVCRMQYIGLITVVVALTNLVPNFGPVIGAAIGGFILLLVNPAHALLFLVFCAFLQFFDAYILKPRLFSNSLGVSGLLILIASIVLGSMFGFWGMLLAIPAAAILSFLYHDYFLPRREKQMKKDPDPDQLNINTDNPAEKQPQ